MREIGGYLELDKYDLPMLHDGAIGLNCGRNALAYLIRAKKIRKIKIPKFLCNSVQDVCIREGIEISYYSSSNDFMPYNVSLESDEWLYIVNYYGQIDNDKISMLTDKYVRVIVDNAQAYFQMPIEGVDTLYTCRKFFGVADGAFLYTDERIEEELLQDESFGRMGFVLGRFEQPASVFYRQASENNDFFSGEQIKYMSKLTENLLHAIDYASVMRRRTENFEILHEAFESINSLRITVPDGAFMYPLYLTNGADIRKYLHTQKIYVPTLWPDVFERCGESELEYKLADNLLPLPCDQRYGAEEMRCIIDEVYKCIS